MPRKKLSAQAKAAQTRKINRQKSQARRQIIAACLIFAGVFIFISVILGKTAEGVTGALGPVGDFIKIACTGLFGILAYIYPLILIYAGILYATNRENLHIKRRIIWSSAFALSASVLIHLFYHSDALKGSKLVSVLWQGGTALKNGGVVGGLIGEGFIYCFSIVGTAIILVFLIIISLIFLTGITLPQIYQFFVPKKDKTKKDKEPKIIPEPMVKKPDIDVKVDDVIALRQPNVEKILKTFEHEEDAIKEDELEKIKPKEEEIIPLKETDFYPQTKAAYIFPSTSLLTKDDRQKGQSRQTLLEKSAKLTSLLKDFGVEAQVINITEGPAATRFELSPKSGVKVSKFTALADDIALGLAAKSVRIEAPIPGKAAIGIEVPNDVISTIRLRDLIESKEFIQQTSNIAVCLGRDITGQPVLADIAKMPHVLIAGATGMGKSVCVNSIIMSILYKASPEQVKFILVDPKMVEFTNYVGIPHLLVPVVTDPKKAAGALNWAVSEMLKRYKDFSQIGAQNITSYNEIRSKEENFTKMQQIVIIIDEFADLMMVAKTEVEDAVCRLAQMGRAAGIHLVIATQRPSADVITGLIKANIPTRIALTVASAMESRIILDMGGAEKLLGRGDMLYLAQGTTKPVRIQGCFVSEKEIRDVVKAIKEIAVAEYDDEVEKIIVDQSVSEDKSKKAEKAERAEEIQQAEDDMLKKAIDIVVEFQQASTSLLQRKLKLGYARAARIMDQMEEMHIVGPYEGSKPRAVLLSKSQWQEMQLQRDDFKEVQQ